MKKIGIVGFGYVGQAIFRLFMRHYQLAVYDPKLTQMMIKYPNLNKLLGNRVSKDAVNQCDLGIICVPTPEKKDGSCDISIVEETVKWLETPLILIKSTVEPKTTEYLKKKYKKRIVFSPEYLGEGKYFIEYWKHPHPTDIRYHTFQIFGGDEKDTSEIVDFFLPVMGPNKTYAQTDSRTAELVKYAENNWGAMKVTWANEWYEICKAFDRDWHKVRELWALDGRVEKMHTAIFKDKRGFSGKCFPKDNKAIVRASEKMGYEPKFLKAMIEANTRFNKLNKKDDKT